jgi:hypothetical protein
MYFLLAQAVINAHGNVVHEKYSMVSLQELIENYMHYGIDMFRCVYAETTVEVTVVHEGDLTFSLTGRTADEDMTFIFSMSI